MVEAPDSITPTRLAEVAEISVPYASQVLSGKRGIKKGLAIKVYRRTGIRLGPIAEASDEEIAVLERFEERAA